MARNGFLVVLALAVGAGAERVELVLGGPGGNPWRAPLAEEGAEGVFYVVYGTDGEPLEQVPVAYSPQRVGADTLVDYSDDSMRPSWVDPSQNLTRIVSWDESGFSQVPFYDLGGNIRVTVAEVAPFIGMILPSTLQAYDGDPRTVMFRVFRQRPDATPGVGRGFRNNMVTNFGAEMPINRIRFYPRLSRTEDAHIIAAMNDPKPDPESFGEESFVSNHLEWYEIAVADNSAPIADDPFVIPKGRRWHKVLARAGEGGYRQSNDPAYTVLRSVRENLDVVVDYRFPRRHVRWVALRALDPLRAWEVAEVEIYGKGFVGKAVYETDVLDFGQAISWGKIRWRGEQPRGTTVEVRTRTGNDPSPDFYWQPNSITGEPEEIGFEEHFGLPINERENARYDRDNWSFWSPPYDFASGLRDESSVAAAWEDGVPLQSPSPSRYIQLRIVMFSTENTAPHLDQLQIQVARSFSASQLVGEIWPNDVEGFGSRRFTYVVRPDFQEGDKGFDRLEILTHTRAESVSAVRVGGTDVDLEEYPPDIRAERVVIALDRKLVSPETDRLKQVEVEFDARVLRFGAEFSGWVYNSDDPDQVRQQVKPGNATYRFGGDVLAVRTELGGDLLMNTRVSPNPFTPNDDGVNDVLELEVDVREVVVRRPLHVEILDVSGRVVQVLGENDVRTGTVQEQWDGRDRKGRLVAPGLYLYRIQLETDMGVEEKFGTIAVAY